jgi:hypothetical protein
MEAAERSLRGLMGDAAKEGDYNAVLQIAGWAKSIGELLARSPSRGSSGGAAAHTAQGDIPDSAVVAPRAEQPPIPDAPPAAQPPARRISRAKDYPKFSRNGNVLVKLGWSKGQKAEYEHKAPFSVARDLATAICQATSKKRRFAMDAILPLKNSGDGQEIPSYQAYACLGWLRHEGLVIQHGRQGYSVKPKTEVDIAIQELFKRLPEQHLSSGQA